WSAVALALAFLISVLWADRCRTVGLRDEVDRLQANAVPRLLIRHVAGCRQCERADALDLGALGFEVSNLGAQTIRNVTVDVGSSPPERMAWSDSASLPPSGIQYPVPLRSLSALTPGEPPAHVSLLFWQLPDIFVLPMARGGQWRFPVGEYTIVVVA